MATDVEESDTDDHERPAPPKRQCKRLVGSNESYESLNERLGESDVRNKNDDDDDGDEEDHEYEEAERLAREKLNIWQKCQVAKGFLDNTINCIVEDYILNPPVEYSPADDPQFRLFRDNDMEDTAVEMAIRNRGLVQTSPCVDILPDICWSNEENSQLSRPIDRSSQNENLPSSSGIFDLTRSIDAAVAAAAAAAAAGGAAGAGCHHGVASRLNEDKMDESDREQDFLERAVAEAIKKKGLSALSVDYG